MVLKTDPASAISAITILVFISLVFHVRVLRIYLDGPDCGPGACGSPLLPNADLGHRWPCRMAVSRASLVGGESIRPVWQPAPANRPVGRPGAPQPPAAFTTTDAAPDLPVCPS